MAELGKLVQVDLRKVWEHEAHEVTPSRSGSHQLFEAFRGTTESNAITKPDADFI
jgi:hypothetical protein